MYVIPTANGEKELFPELPSSQLRYYADILEEACAPDEDMENAEDPNLEEMEHDGKTSYEEYKG